MKRSKDPSMARLQHDRPVAAAVFAHVFGVQPLGQHEIDLQCAALPLPADGVGELEVEFRPIERPVARIQRVPDPGLLHRAPERRFRPVPGLVGSRADFRPIGKPRLHLLETEVPVNSRQQVAETAGFRVDLVLGAEDMGVVLDETTHPHQSVQRTGGFVPMARPEFRHP